jgi:hypothetical protein
MWFMALLTVATLGISYEALAMSCNGVCGGGSADGSCYCDDACFEYGDCCGDVCTACPTLTGCGGGTSNCGNGYCEPTEDASSCPQDCSAGCGSVSYEGCCQGETVQYCEGGSLKSIDCNQNPSCGWSAEGGYYDCGTTGGADPSGMNPKVCSGGTGPICGNGSCEPGENGTSCPSDCGGTNPVCGNGYCEVGENATSCPQDCGGGTNPVCGNGACEQGETATSCPQDCGQGCGGKQCGFDAQGNPCGSCPDGFFCTWDGVCESDTPCEPECAVGQQCGDDGCNGSCGTCPAGLVCSAANTCISPMGQDITLPDEDVSCQGSCVGKVCGDDGCGGQCGTCPEGYGCTLDGMCEEGFVAPEIDAYQPGEDPYACPEGQTLLYGKCVAKGDDGGSNSNCSVGGSSPTSAALIALLFLLLVLRRKETA